MTPGAYLKARRCDAGLSIDDLARALATWPRVHVLDRAEWLRLIEADVMPATFSTIVAIAAHVHIDMFILTLLDQIHQGSSITPPQLCRVCGGGYANKPPPGQEWTVPDLCTTCDGMTPEVGAALEALR